MIKTLLMGIIALLSIGTFVYATYEPKPRLINVYLLKNTFGENWEYKPMKRLIKKGDYTNFLVQKLIDGPTAAELKKDYLTPLILEGRSNCGGLNFSSSYDSSNSLVTIQFCRDIKANAINEGVLGTYIKGNGRIKTALAKTLIFDRDVSKKGFQGPQFFRILDKAGNCFAPDITLNNEKCE
ncbi:MAG: hypothetical protein ACRCXZ_08585 [Patescibacteria group bacterium]